MLTVQRTSEAWEKTSYVRMTAQCSDVFHAEMAMRRFFFSQPNPTDQLTDPTQPNPSYQLMDPAIVVKFELLNSVLCLNLMNFIKNNIKFRNSRMQIIACISANIIYVNVPC